MAQVLLDYSHPFMQNYPQQVLLETGWLDKGLFSTDYRSSAAVAAKFTDKNNLKQHKAQAVSADSPFLAGQIINSKKGDADLLKAPYFRETP